MASALVIWLHGLQSSSCHIQQLLVSTRTRRKLPWVKWLLPDSDITSLTVLPHKKLKSWFDLHRQPVVEGEEHQGMREAVARIHRVLFAALEEGFQPDRIVLCGFSQGGALALQSALSFPHTLAGVCSIAGWSTAGIPAAERKMPILMCHGSEDSMVPIDVARKSCSTLAALGYEVNLVTFKGLRHQLSTLQFEELLTFYEEVIPQRLEIGTLPVAKPAGCIVWMHDASIMGEINEQLLASRLSESLPEVHLLLRRLPGKLEGQNFGRILFEEVKAQLSKAQETWHLPLSSIVLGGFGAGGTAALLGLLYPLAGIASCSSFLADGFPEQPVEPGTDQLILLTHGVEDQVVPISAAREQQQSLAAHGYRAVTFSAFGGCGHELTLDVWDTVIEFVEAALDEESKH